MIDAVLDPVPVPLREGVADHEQEGVRDAVALTLTEPVPLPLGLAVPLRVNVPVGVLVRDCVPVVLTEPVLVPLVVWELLGVPVCEDV